MKIFHNFEGLDCIKNPVVTTGSFDGVHLGHKVIIDRLNQIASDIVGESVLITFYPHPRKVLYPEAELSLINSQEEKIELLRNAKLDNLIIINFTLEFSQISSREFIIDLLLHKLHAKVIVVGFNHHFGHNREGDYSFLDVMKQEYNFNVEEIPEQDIENESVSSTKIRKALQDGNIQRANAYLDHFYMIKGRLIEGSFIYSNLGLPTLKLIINEEEKLVPPDGIYAIHAIINNNYHKGMMLKDNSSGKNKSIEFHFFELNRPILNQDATIYLHKRIESEDVFKDHKDLKKNLLSISEKISELIY